MILLSMKMLYYAILYVHKKTTRTYRRDYAHDNAVLDNRVVTFFQWVSSFSICAFISWIYKLE